MDFNRVIILGSARAGSKLLMQTCSRILDRGDAWQKGEILNPKLYPQINNYTSWEEQVAYIQGHAMTKLFKIQDYQFAQNGITLEMLLTAFPTAHYILLNRENRLHQYVSQRLGQKEENYGRKKYEHDTQFTFDPVEYYEHAQQRTNFLFDAMRWFNFKQINYLPLNFYSHYFQYEDLQRLALFLKRELPPHSLMTDLHTVRQRDLPIESHLTNPSILDQIPEIHFKI